MEKVFEFEETQELPIYSFGLYAGPFGYHEEDQSKTIQQGDLLDIPPMRIYARKSQLEYIDHQEMFLATRNALNFYSRYFGLNFPFSKCDQVFAPSHNYDGLSTQGIISYNERFLYNEKANTSSKEKMTKYKKMQFIDTVLHELAHQWFGNIVTPKWWDDLWIMEAFATFMSFEALEA